MGWRSWSVCHRYARTHRSTLSRVVHTQYVALVAGIMTFIATAEIIPAALADISGVSLSSWFGVGVMRGAICDLLLSSKVQQDPVR